MMIVMIMMMLSVTDPFQLGVDESLPHGACDRSQWQHRPCYKLIFQVIVFYYYRNCSIRYCNTMIIWLQWYVMVPATKSFLDDGSAYSGHSHGFGRSSMAKKFVTATWYWCNIHFTIIAQHQAVDSFKDSLPHECLWYDLQYYHSLSSSLSSY